MKTHLFTFSTMGPPYDHGFDMRPQVADFLKYFSMAFDEVHIFNSQMLLESSPEWSSILSPSADSINYTSDQQPYYSWSRLNYFLWKPHLFRHIITSAQYSDGDLFFYHDINTSKWNDYAQSHVDLPHFLLKSLSRHDVLLFSENLQPLNTDCKEELLKQYCLYPAKHIPHISAFSLAFIKNSRSTLFLNQWTKMSSELTALNMTTTTRGASFKWHSPDQATLSVTFYLNLLSLSKSCRVKHLILDSNRKLPPPRVPLKSKLLLYLHHPGLILTKTRILAELVLLLIRHHLI